MNPRVTSAFHTYGIRRLQSLGSTRVSRYLDLTERAEYGEGTIGGRSSRYNVMPSGAGANVGMHRLYDKTAASRLVATPRLVQTGRADDLGQWVCAG